MSKKKQKRNEFRVKNTKDGKGHPTYVYARTGDEYSFLGITHAEITKGVRNIPLERNPNPKENKKAYIRPNADKSHRSSFGKKLKGWSFSDNDKKKIDKYKK